MHLLTTQQMAQADQLTMDSGLSGCDLMQNAAEAVASIIRQLAGADQLIQILCGPGNNGGDGYALGAILVREWRNVEIFAVAAPKDDSDAAWARSKWGKDVRPLSEFRPDGSAIIVDALFGAGLSRPLEGDALEAVERANGSAATIVAVDIPSGIGGNDGKIYGTAIEASDTVTFFRGKPGHWLYPGRGNTGRLHVKQIGIEERVLRTIDSNCRLNGPFLWIGSLPSSENSTHKYERGAALIFSGAALSTGASRLSALAAARAGAGAVTLVAPPDAARVHAAHLTAIMVNEAETREDALERACNGKERAAVIGPGYGVGEPLKKLVLGLLKASNSALKTIVLDADALTSFREDPETLFDAIRAGKKNVVLTPHEGEFSRLFPNLAEGHAKTEKAAEAARRSGAIVLLKGSDTVIAEPDGCIAINPNGTPLLATAGSGDVLAGIIAGLAAQNMPLFLAACAAAWLHAEAARSFGRGLVADDLPDQLPAILESLFDTEERGQ
ncbi:NAD(P)H-hydrate dehydratase [Notoacmeibacter ruber]|uniref:Bifunctional NAD(P)H-hydrate repair enzyme n=1 Tax=Notoacmeibacter ruber TaxID=2670375 RepID=A0A3L7JGZ9_9HYPH|nr:NAD(P)H-hydrate dehydratase [Notoacmeibacter ruber]RLQ89439.1 NAD(P)H-hydrate dehydratase [Notoacmeibacter ruber]